MQLRTNYLDYSNITDPYGSHLIAAVEDQFTTQFQTAKRIFYHRNTFQRFDTYEQILTDFIEEYFLSFRKETKETEIINLNGSNDHILAQYEIMLDENLTIKGRTVYSLM